MAILGLKEQIRYSLDYHFIGISQLASFVRIQFHLCFLSLIFLQARTCRQWGLCTGLCNAPETCLPSHPLNRGLHFPQICFLQPCHHTLALSLTSTWQIWQGPRRILLQHAKRELHTSWQLAGFPLSRKWVQPRYHHRGPPLWPFPCLSKHSYCLHVHS